MNLLDDRLAIVVPKTTAEFLIVHGRLVFLLPPHLGHCRGLEDFELIVLILCPLDQVSTRGTDEELKEELPKLDGAIT